MSIIDLPAPAVVAPERRRLMGSAYDLSGATNAAEARALAGLEWEATHRPLYVDLPDDMGGLALVERERGVVRSDNGEMFGVVGREHKILSNQEFFDFAEVLLSQADTTWADAAPFGGALGGGKQPFLAFRLGEGIQVAGEDAVDNHVLLSNGHVGNMAFTVTVLPLRYQCSNVVRAALRTGRNGKNMFVHSVQHSGDLASKVAEAQAALNMTSAYMREFESLANRMADIDFTFDQFDAFLSELIPVSETAGDRAKTAAEDQRAAMRSNWRNTTTLTVELKSTLWGALNVVTEVIDHGNLDVRKSKIPAQERRMRSVHFGTGARLRDRAYNLLAGI